jgi:hypothetical protein
MNFSIKGMIDPLAIPILIIFAVAIPILIAYFYIPFKFTLSMS